MNWLLNFLYKLFQSRVESTCSKLCTTQEEYNSLRLFCGAVHTELKSVREEVKQLRVQLEEATKQ